MARKVPPLPTSSRNVKNSQHGAPASGGAPCRHRSYKIAGARMKRTNYKQEKRLKEIEKQRKKEAKKERKLQKEQVVPEPDAVKPEEEST